MKTYNFIYKTTNLINGTIYIGKHMTDDLNDSYLGSGTAINRAFKKYGKQSFSREILTYCDTYESLNENEKHFIKSYIDSGYRSYNIALGGDYGFTLAYARKAKRRKVLKKISESLKEYFANADAETIAKLRAKQSEAYWAIDDVRRAEMSMKMSLAKSGKILGPRGPYKKKIKG